MGGPRFVCFEFFISRSHVNGQPRFKCLWSLISIRTTGREKVRYSTERSRRYEFRNDSRSLSERFNAGGFDWRATHASSESLYTTRDSAAKCMHSGGSGNDEDLRGRRLVRHVLHHLPVVGGSDELARPILRWVRWFGHVAPQRWTLVSGAEWDCGEQGLLLVRQFRQEWPRRRIESRNRWLGAGSIPVSQAHDGDRSNIGCRASDYSKRRPSDIWRA
jgi:hypothetical protein